MSTKTSKLFIKLFLYPFMSLFNACSPLGSPLDENISPNHYFSKNKKDIIFSSGGNWFSLGKKNLNADIESFKLLNDQIAKDKNRLYFRQFVVDNNQIDLPTLRVVNQKWMQNIAFDKAHVYIFDRYKKSKIKIIQGADPKKFKMIDNDWGKDSTNHFFKGEKVDADYNSFQSINKRFYKDQFNSYFISKNKLIKFLSDKSTLQKVDDEIVRDAYNIYYYTSYYNGRPVYTVNPIPYKDFNQVNLFDKKYIRADNNIYYLGTKLEKADAFSFKVYSNSSYAKDKNVVYYKGNIIKEADAFSFMLKDGYFQDKNHKYREGIAINNTKYEP